MIPQRVEPVKFMFLPDSVPERTEPALMNNSNSK